MLCYEKYLVFIYCCFRLVMNPMFKQLTTGVHFDTKLYRTEAEQFGLGNAIDFAVRCAY